MRIKCPNCHHGLEIVPNTPAELITCPYCGSQLDPNSGETAYRPDSRRTVGRFELLEHVGCGHFGNVWRAAIRRSSGNPTPPRGHIVSSAPSASLRPQNITRRRMDAEKAQKRLLF